PYLRMPFFGTSLALLARGPLGPRKARYFARSVAGAPIVNLELHGIDFLDTQDGLRALSRHQPGLDIPWQAKLETYLEAVQELRRRGFAWTTLHELAIEALP
ncbi:MAG: polysaccharide deacetylase, partial [Myxococcales bacterium]|nr:polysaccharide deacetylase [Myxococcales bacterium]